MNELIIPALLCVGITLLGAFTQRVSGFGLGIVVMTVSPFLFPTFGEATALAGLISLLSTTYLTVRYRKSIRWRLVLWPLVAFIPVNFLAIRLVAEADIRLLKAALGVLLVLLSIYFIGFSQRLRIKANTATGLISGGLSGLLGGAFSMGGPPIVVYLLAATEEDTTAYLATIQCVFALTGYVATAGRIVGGFVTPRVLLLLPVALAGMALGNLLGGRVYRRLNAQTLRWCVYGFMAVAGGLMVVTAL